MEILLIEDEPLILNSLKKLLSSETVKVDATLSGKEAIKLLSNKNYNKIICDLMLKDITGFDVIEAARKVYSPEEISKKFIIITAYCSGSILSKAQKYNCTVLAKPFENINQAISKILS